MRLNLVKVYENSLATGDNCVALCQKSLLDLFTIRGLPLDKYDSRHINCLLTAVSVFKMAGNEFEKYSPDFQVFWGKWVVCENFINLIRKDLENEYYLSSP